MDTEIPFSKPYIGEDEIGEIISVLKGKWLTTGKKAEEFENNIKEYLGVDLAVAVSSGTAALDISLAVNGIGKGDEVITTPYTFVSSVMSIVHSGARPILIDVQEDSFNIDPTKISEYIEKRYEKTDKGLLSKINGKILKAILVVHFGGQPADMDEINEIARRYNIIIIEDAAHSIGAKYKGIKTGDSDNPVCFSFYSNKNITTGEGGMIVCKSREREKIYRQYSLHGISKNNFERYKTGLPFYDVNLAGFKNNLTDIQAALGVAQMKKIDKITEARNRVAKWYDEGLKDIEEINIPEIKSHNYSARHLYPVLLKEKFSKKRDELILRMREKNIFPSVHFIPVHQFTFFKNYFNENEVNNLSVSENLFKREISLPIFPELKREEVARVVQAIRDFF